MGCWSHRAWKNIPGFTIPWSLLAAHEERALSNHHQTLERLAQRGGLDAAEAADILLDRPLVGKGSVEHPKDILDRIEILRQALKKIGHDQVIF